jgi:hypothetical protein
MNGINDKYVIVQELLQNPYIIDGRKTNMRFYVLVICKNNKFSVYVYNDGFMYYTKVPFKKNTTEVDPNITTGYIDREVYKKNPLTHQDLKKYLDNPNRNMSEIEHNMKNKRLVISEVYFIRINNLLKDIFSAFVGYIGVNDKFVNNTMTQLFGVDIAVDDQLNPMLMEVNKGPDMNAKDERDSQLKNNVVTDMLKTLGIIDNNNNGFVKILDV